ncbi:MAG TPA: hypothetical protein VFU07_05620 [Candidatus Lumbricidophila sp.]|nr:hypothetical protein [Candidatus Lumbricidophila sp.]
MTTLDEARSFLERAVRDYDLAQSVVDRHQAEQFLAVLPELIREEQAVVDAKLDEHHYLVNKMSDGYSVKVHALRCLSIRHQIDRSLAWQLFTDQATDRDLATSLLRNGSFPQRLPVLATAAEIAHLRKFTVCQNCNPPLVPKGVKQSRKTWPTTIGKLTYERLGREYETATGTPLGHLVEIVVTVGRVVARFTDGELSGDPATELVLLERSLNDDQD